MLSVSRGVALLIVACSSLTGCLATTQMRATYPTALVEVARPRATKEQWGGVDKITPSDSSRFAYEDSMVTIKTMADESSIAFSVTNKTEHSIKIIWDEASFIDATGGVSKVMHAGVKFADRNASQPPTIVPARQTVVDAAFPNDRVVFVEGYYGTYYSSAPRWIHKALVEPAFKYLNAPSKEQNQADQSAFTIEARLRIGARMGLVLPLQIEGVTNEYTLWFEIRDARIVGPFKR